MKMAWLFGTIVSISTAITPSYAIPPEPVCSGINNMIYHLDLGPNHVHIRLRHEGNEFLTSSMPGWECGADPPTAERDGSIFLSGLACWHKVITGSDEDNYPVAGQTFIKYLKIVNKCFGDKVINETPSMIRANDVQYENMIILLSKSAQHRKVRIEFSYGRGAIGAPFYWSIETQYTSIPAD